MPRGKTGVSRNFPLWPETVQALKEVPKLGELVFYTARGHTCVRVVRTMRDDERIKYNSSNAVTRRFSELLKLTGIEVEKGLRRTAATLAANSGDAFAVQKLLGHADVRMASTYVQNISEQADRVIINSRKLIIQDDS